MTFTTLGTDDENLRITVTDDLTANLTVIAVTGQGEGGAVDSVNGATGVVVLDTDDIAEGSTNQYYTDARFDGRFGTKTTTSLTEGSNLYYTNSRFDTRLATKDTDDLTEGVSNLYYTDARADARIAAADTDDITEGSTNLYFTDARADARIAAADTDDLSEGSTNLYYTTSRQNTDFDTRLATKSTSDVAEGTNLYYTDARADARIAAADTDDLTEGSTNLYYTDARADARIAAADLQDLSNVNDALNPSDGQVLAWDNANSYWTNADAAGGGLTQSTTPTITYENTATVLQGYVYGQITNWGSYTSPSVEFKIDSTGLTRDFVSIVELSSADTFSLDASNGKFCVRMPDSAGTKALKIRVQDFGESASTEVSQNITVAAATVSSGSYRYYKISSENNVKITNNNLVFSNTTSDNQFIEEFNLFTSAGATGTQYPATMTANTTGSEVASSSDEFSATYAAWKAFDRNSGTGTWTLSSGVNYSTHFLKIDLGTNRTIESFKLECNSNERKGHFVIQGSTDDVTYYDIVEVDGPPLHLITDTGGITIG